MNSNVQTPKSRAVLVGLCAAALFLWAVAVYVTYQDSKMTRYNVSIKPGAVNYGTHSTVTMPPVMHTSYRHSTPMISGDAVRAYAHAGHAAMPMASTGSSSGFRIHTTSSATMHSIGGGGSTGGGGMMSSSGGSSSRGIRYSGGSVSMPILAFAASSSTVSSAYPSSGFSAPGMKKVKPNGDGEYNGEYYNGQWWNENEEDWYDEPFDGAIRNNGGVMERYEGTYPTGSWVPVSNQGDPGVPVGATPWILMLLLAGAYALYVRAKSRKYTNQ